MKFMVNCAFSTVLSMLLATSSSAFSNSPLKTLSTTTFPSIQHSALCMSGETDDYDDFFADYDPSQYDSYENNSFDDNSGASYGRGGGGYQRGGGRGGGGGGRSWDYTRDTSRDSSNVDEATIEDLVKQRSQAKRNRDYTTADAIRDELMDDYKVGIDDREKTWRTGVSRSGSGRGNFRGGRGGGGRGSPHRGGSGRRPRQDFGPNGHDYQLAEGSGPNSSGMSDQEINEMIAERLMAKLSRDFGTADSIQVDLVARGVFVHDGIKEFRTDGVAFGDFSERRGDRRGNPGPTRGSRSDSISYRKSSFSVDADGIDDEMIDKLVAERSKCKMMRDFEKADAIREGLRTRYNVLIDDRLKMWSVGGDFGEEHNARRELSHQFATRGYIKSQSSLPLSQDDEAYVQEQIDERSAAKRDRDFQTADDIRENLLQQFDVSIDDKLKLWSIGGVFEESGGKTGSARGVYTRRGGGNLSEDTVAEIQDLLMERYQHKKNRDFESADAIRDDLMNRYDVKIDDRSSEWRIDTNEYFPTFTGNLSQETIAEINEKLAERFQCKRDRDYDAADAIRDQLGETYGVVVDDRTKEWKVEPVEEPQYSEPNDPEEGDDFFNDLDAALDEQMSDDDEEETASDEEEDNSMDEDDNASLSEEELSKLTIPVLKEKLRDAGLPVSGKKAELIARLLTN